MSFFTTSDEIRALIKQEVGCEYMLKKFDEIHDALEHAVLIAEGKQSGNWDDVMQYRQLLRTKD